MNNKIKTFDMNHIITYYDNGNIWYEHYFLYGIYHRLDGPAWIEYYPNGNIRIQRYYINGKYLPLTEIDDILEQCNNDKDLLKDLLTIKYM